MECPQPREKVKSKGKKTEFVTPTDPSLETLDTLQIFEIISTTFRFIAKVV